MTIKSPTYVPALIALATWGCASHAAPADQLQPPSENTDAALISELKSHCGENSTVECMADPKLVYVSSPGPCETGLLSCATGTRFCAVKSEEALSLARETARAMFLQRSMRLLIDDSSRTTALLMAQAAGNEIAQTFYRVRIDASELLDAGRDPYRCRISLSSKKLTRLSASTPPTLQMSEDELTSFLVTSLGRAVDNLGRSRGPTFPIPRLFGH